MHVCSVVTQVIERNIDRLMEKRLQLKKAGEQQELEETRLGCFKDEIDQETIFHTNFFLSQR